MKTACPLQYSEEPPPFLGHFLYLEFRPTQASTDKNKTEIPHKQYNSTLNSELYEQQYLHNFSAAII